MVEHYVDIVGVTSSNLVPPTIQSIAKYDVFNPLYLMFKYQRVTADVLVKRRAQSSVSVSPGNGYNLACFSTRIDMVF